MFFVLKVYYYRHAAAHNNALSRKYYILLGRPKLWILKSTGRPHYPRVLTANAGYQHPAPMRP